MTFEEYYFESDEFWFDTYIFRGESAYIEMYELEDELMEWEKLNNEVIVKQNKSKF